MLKIYTIYDSKSETYTEPTYHPARGQAIRALTDAVNGGQGVISDHPADFTLFELGSFDQRTGQITLEEARISVANGLDLFMDQQLDTPQPQLKTA